jgi:hypothetical protein
VALWRLGPPPVVPELSPDLLDLHQALRMLPLGQRQVIVLHHLVGLPVEEVARELRVPTGTVKSRLARGRRALARCSIPTGRRLRKMNGLDARLQRLAAEATKHAVGPDVEVVLRRGRRRRALSGPSWLAPWP